MSAQDFIGFLEAVKTDPELQERVEGIHDGTLAEKLAQLIDIGRMSGFTFTDQEIDGLFFSQAAAEASAELDREELESVAGGMMNATHEMTEMNQSFSLQYLGLQQNLQQENRQFTMMSNILKAKRDAARASINNTR